MGPAVSCRRGNHRQKSPYDLSRAPVSLDSCLDINKATAEELMTLPGIDRSLAQGITVHRHKIQGFRRVEDLALVAGVGAERMLELRPEIRVGNFPLPWRDINGTETLSDSAVTPVTKPETETELDTGQSPADDRTVWTPCEKAMPAENEI